MSRQTDLDQGTTRPVIKRAGFSYGFTQPTNRPPVPPGPNPNAPPVIVQARTHKFLSSSFTVGTDVSTVAGMNDARAFLSFQNNGAATIYLAFGVQPSTNGENSFILPVNGYLSFEFDIVPNNEVYAVSSGSSLTIIEGIRN